MTTVIEREKVTRAVAAQTPGGAAFSAYEIHMGRTTQPADSKPFAFVGEREEGIRDGRCLGTYLHGALEHAAVVEEVLGVRVPPAPDKDACYDRLADWFEEAADTKLFEELYL